MKILVGDEVTEFRRLFTRPLKEDKEEIATPKISPSGLQCQVAVWYKLHRTPMSPEERTFETDGYASSGSDRHKVIQKYLSECPGITWVNVEEYVKENNLPFNVEYEIGIKDLAEKYNLTCDQVCEIVGSYERLLKHTNNLMNLKLDGIVKFKGEYYILEIKTASKAKAERAPLQEHQLQGKTYSLMLKIPKIIWVYENREDFKHTIAFQEVSDEDRLFIKNYLNQIVKAESPKELTRYKDCKYCRYRETCMQDFKEEIQNECLF